MNKSLSQLKVYLMNSIVIKLRGVNQRSRSVYSEVRATKGQILKKFALDLIKSDLFNLIPCELDLTSTPFKDETIITYDIELPPYGK